MLLSNIVYWNLNLFLYSKHEYGKLYNRGSQLTTLLSSKEKLSKLFSKCVIVTCFFLHNLPSICKHILMQPSLKREL